MNPQGKPGYQGRRCVCSCGRPITDRDPHGILCESCLTDFEGFEAENGDEGLDLLDSVIRENQRCTS